MGAVKSGPVSSSSPTSDASVEVFRVRGEVADGSDASDVSEALALSVEAGRFRQKTIAFFPGGLTLFSMIIAALEEVLALMQALEAQPGHVSHVTNLALQLFDELTVVHGLRERERLLLQAAGYLHDIGHHFDHLGTSHHKESARIIREHAWKHLSLLEVDLISQIARYHRRSMPSMKHEPFAMLLQAERLIVQRLSALLRIADALDRSHEQHVTRVTVEVLPDKLIFHLDATGPVLLEVIVAQVKGDLARAVFQRDLVFMLGQEVVEQRL